MAQNYQLLGVGWLLDSNNDPFPLEYINPFPTSVDECDIACHAKYTLFTELVGFSFNGAVSICACWVRNSSTNTLQTLGNVDGDASFIGGGGVSGDTYCYACLSTAPSSQPSSQPSRQVSSNSDCRLRPGSMFVVALMGGGLSACGATR